MNNFRLKSIVLLSFLCYNLFSQNTVGTLVNTPQSYNGYTLLTPVTSFQSYLIDNCGRVVNSWNSSFMPALSAYLLEDGSLMRSGRILNSNMNMGGLAGRVEKISWDGFLEWRYRCSGLDSTSHHDFEVLPNGNILLLVAFRKPISEAIAIGRDSNSINDNFLFSESVLEIEPIGIDSGRIVWRWDAWDHLIQDRDSSKPYYGVIADHPEKMNINYLGTSTSQDWLHSNSIDYNPELDQIVISFRHISEFWIIDHSTSIIESASSSGGRYNKGGDILYRWGNPAAYNRGALSDQKLFGQHYVKWIEKNLPGEGNLLLFNNGDLTGISSVEEIQAPMDSAGYYNFPGPLAFGPTAPIWFYSNSSNQLFNSGRLSSAKRLPNNNTLICSGLLGYLSEIDSIGNLVWSYRNPITSTGIISQGSTVNNGVNAVFSAERYAPDYAAFNGRTLNIGNPLELNFNLNNCQIFNSLNTNDGNTHVNIYPNPANDFIFINSSGENNFIKIYNTQGILCIEKLATNQIEEVNISDLPAGLYTIILVSDKGIKDSSILHKY